MSPRKLGLVSVGVLVLCAHASAAQAPTATIAGAVTDATGAVLVDARIVVRETGTGMTRTARTRDNGRFSLDSLRPSTYDVEVDHHGFVTARRRATLQVGDNLALDFALGIGNRDERVDVAAESSGINGRDVEVRGSVGRTQIEQLPLNGRSFLELAQLQPAVDVVSVTNPGAFGNNYQRVLIAGAYYSQTRITVDGSTTGDRFVGGTMQGLSQESVQEFQVATFSLSPATGVAGSGAINIVTRSGSNDFSGSAFTFYRDHHLAAYPGLRRDAVPPPFARRQSGASAGGPLRHDRTFWFANYEHNNQDAVYGLANNHPIFSKFDGIYPNPLDSHQVNSRFDSRISDAHQAFARFTMDANDTTSPAVAVGMPSNWQSVRNRAVQAQVGLVSVLKPTVVNDLRLSYGALQGDLNPVAAEQCTDPVACVGAGGPNILVFDAPQFRIGNQFNSPFARRQRTFQVVDNLTWQRGDHQIRLGGEWERAHITASLAFNEPAQVTLWGPSNLQNAAFRSFYDALPASLKDPAAPAPTLADILRLPLRTFTTGIGDPSLPGPYNADQASHTDRFRGYIQDAWSITPSLTLSAGLAYVFDTHLFAEDLDYPVYLRPILGDDLRPITPDANNFDPSLGLAWSIGSSRRTIIRLGGGTYHDEGTLFWKARERAFIGPSGNGRVTVDGSVANLDFSSSPTTFTGGDLVAVLPGLRADLAARFGDGTDLSRRGIDVIKQGDQIVDPHATTAYSIQANAGIQREFGTGWALTADYVMRRYVHVGPLQGVYSIDRNRFNRPRVTGVDATTGVVSFVRNPIIPLCSAEAARAFNPDDDCSTGPINIFGSGANFRYQGLNLTLEKRYSSGWQFKLGYAFSRNTGFIDGGFTSYDDYSLAYGNIPNHRRHRLTLSGVWTLPDYNGTSGFWRAVRNSWTVAFNSQIYSAPPLNTLLAGLDLDGDGISLTLLPGTTHNSLGQGLSAAELRRLVDDYNAAVEDGTRRVVDASGAVTIVRPRTPFNQVMTPITLPEHFSNGDSFITQDVRVTRAIRMTKQSELSLVGEAFNVFNIANMTGYSGVLNQPNYGTASARVAQVFGTGGPRAFQVALRLRF